MKRYEAIAITAENEDISYEISRRFECRDYPFGFEGNMVVQFKGDDYVIAAPLKIAGLSHLLLQDLKDKHFIVLPLSVL